MASDAERGTPQANPTWDQIEVKVRSAIAQLREVDGFLLENEANERTITHRLAMYLEAHFPEWHVDVEYNRTGIDGDPKRIDWRQIAGGAGREELVTDTEARTIYPDIIVHRRGNQENLMALEMKKSSSRRLRGVDREKLRRMLQEDHLRYQYAAFLELPVGNAATAARFLLERVE